MAKQTSPVVSAAEQELEALLQKFMDLMQPFGTEDGWSAYEDNRTGARYCECHVLASKLIEHGTTDFPLDLEEQSEYRANRELVVIAPAFDKMRDDAIKGRTFSNIVCEFTEDFEPERPVKIIGGQHRFQAIKEALESGVDAWHGLKVYFALDKDQRLDVQLISNTSIAISGDLLDRMQETVKGPELRNWCQMVGLLGKGEDFADKRVRGGAISVQIAKTFILNYFLGTKVDPEKFDATDTVPTLCSVGEIGADWEKLLHSKPKLYEDAHLLQAGKEFVRLSNAQRAAFSGKKAKADQPEKAMNLAVMAAWAYVAGILQKNSVRLKRHYALADKSGTDPLGVAALTFGKHKTDPDNYRGLGYRTDAKERGRLVELFWLQAEDGAGYGRQRVELAVSKRFAKDAALVVEAMKAKGA